jgi:two-component system KDP operon response regulator KdpE
MHNRKILVIDDDPGLMELLQHLFGREGAQVLAASNAQEGLRQFYAHRPDLVILDIMMPGTDGWKVCKSLRQLSDVPILMLTVLDSAQDIARALDGGADDFVTKPFSNQVLLARARALLRRAPMVPENEKAQVYDDGNLTVDLGRRQVWLRQQRIRLSLTEYGMLTCLVQNAGRVLTYEQILRLVWGEAYLGNTQYVHVYIHSLRRKLEEDPAHPRYLWTEPGVGYRFEPQRP